jgi:hypothetical protein
MQHIAGFIELSEDIAGRHLPGVFFLLTHRESAIRAFAAKLVKAQGTIGLDMFVETVQSTFVSWYKVSTKEARGPFFDPHGTCRVPRPTFHSQNSQVLEDEYLRGSGQEQPQPPSAPPPRGGPDATETWKALRCFLEQVDGRDEALGAHLLSEHPLLVDIVVQHAEDATAPASGGGSAVSVPTQRVALGTLRLLLDRFGGAVWRHAEGVGAGSVLKWIKARLQASTAARAALQPAFPEAVFLALLHLLQALLRSLGPHSGRGGSIGSSWHGGLAPSPRPQARRGWLVDSAIRTLARVGKELPVTAPLAWRRYLTSTLCDILADAYNPMTASVADWPLASADDWAPLLVEAMRPLDARSHEVRARDTVLLVLRQHARAARERFLELARGGWSVADEEEEDDEDEESKAAAGGAAGRDFFCRRLMHELARVHPLPHLAPDIRDCLFSIQVG